jgi:hypothetical protein
MFILLENEQVTMKIFPAIVSVILFAIAGCVNDDNKSAECGLKEDLNKNSTTVSILFIGTSHTFYNELPQLVRSIGRSMGDSVYTEMSAPGGYDFERHFRLTETKIALSSRKWDYIVLQESGWRTALPESMANARVYPFADSLKALIDVNNLEAKLILYMTNGYIGGVNAFGEEKWCSEDPQVCTYEGMQDRIRETYLKLSDQMKAEIAPCGIVWKMLRSNNPNIPLHDPDGIHPSLLGSYSNAITIYSMVRKKKIKEVFVPSGVTNEQAMDVQKTVSSALFDCNPDWKNF